MGWKVTMSELGALIQRFRDGERGVISDAEIGRQVGVSRGAIGGWIRGLSAMPRPEHLRAFARYTGVPYARVLQAALVDAGYGDNEPAGDPVETRSERVRRITEQIVERDTDALRRLEGD